MMSDSFMMRYSVPSILTSVPDHLPNSTMSPALTSSGIELAALVAATGANGDDLALHRLLLGGVRDDDATLGLGVFFDALDDDAVVQTDGTSWFNSFWMLMFLTPYTRREDWARTLAALAPHIKVEVIGA